MSKSPHGLQVSNPKISLADYKLLESLHTLSPPTRIYCMTLM
tara:strand:- start:1694 stop:1819 length:126 start_codon:yes stop_codon:yes gene_type:complete